MAFSSATDARTRHPWAGRLYERLARDFPRDQLFMDVDAIEPGLDFFTVLDDHVASCEVLLAIIGPDWVEARNKQGIRRLDDLATFGSARTRKGWWRSCIGSWILDPATAPDCPGIAPSAVGSTR